MVFKLSSRLIVSVYILDVESFIWKTIWRCYAFFSVIHQLEDWEFNWKAFVLFKQILIIDRFLWIGHIKNELSWMTYYNFMISIMFLISKLSNLNHFLLFIIDLKELLSTYIWNSYRVVVIKIIQKLNWLSWKLKLWVSSTVHIRSQADFSNILLKTFFIL